jgi:hypothetical protein
MAILIQATALESGGAGVKLSTAYRCIAQCDFKTSTFALARKPNKGHVKLSVKPNVVICM